MKFGIGEIARHCLQRVRPDFAAGVRPGDVLVAGPNFGIGSSREQAAAAWSGWAWRRWCAVYNGLCFRNAFNVGLLLLTCPHAARLVEGERVSLDPDAGRIHRRDGEALACEPLPDFLLDMVRAGGLLNQLKALQKSAATGRPGSGQCHRILTNRNCHHAEPRHPGRAQRPAGAESPMKWTRPCTAAPSIPSSPRRDACHGLYDAASGAGAGQVRPAGVRGRHVIRGPGRRPPRGAAACGMATSGS